MSDGRTRLYTFTGRSVDLVKLDPDDVVVDDVAHALALTNRYTGHTREPYSVAQHSVLVSLAVASGWEREALMHDAPEYLVCDLSRPLKNALGVSNFYHDIEFGVHCVMARKFGYRVSDELGHVKLADDRVAATEMRDLFDPPRPSRLVSQGVVPLDINIVPWPWEFAERQFLKRFKELFG